MDLSQFVRVRLTHNPHDSRTKYSGPSPLQPSFAGRCGRVIVQFGRHMRFLVSPFHMFYCMDSYVTDSYPNRAIQFLTIDADPKPRAWRGTVLFLRIVNQATPEYVDIRLRDVLDIREYFVHFR
ncbi:hypothetical protein C8Q76DRAFT_394182 [Earliella scabrosa]|nr:hypothetical protein C8Q76DRAFT_394182 [Earliella scabrosa]